MDHTLPLSIHMQRVRPTWHRVAHENTVANKIEVWAMRGIVAHSGPVATGRGGMTERWALCLRGSSLGQRRPVGC